MERCSQRASSLPNRLGGKHEQEKQIKETNPSREQDCNRVRRGDAPALLGYALRGVSLSTNNLGSARPNSSARLFQTTGGRHPVSSNPRSVDIPAQQYSGSLFCRKRNPRCACAAALLLLLPAARASQPA